MGYVAYGLKYNKYNADLCYNMRLDTFDGVYLHSKAQELNDGYDLFLMDIDDIKMIQKKGLAVENIKLICNGKVANMKLYYYRCNGMNRGYICEGNNKEALENVIKRKGVI